jgi:hypothetical protein
MAAKEDLIRIREWKISLGSPEIEACLPKLAR